VYSGKCGTRVDHSVLVVGYGEAKLPPPAPGARCTRVRTIGCYNDTGISLFPRQERELHDHVSVENCAAACFFANATIAGIDGGNHCSCGDEAALSNATGRLRPQGECEVSNCTGAHNESCGGTGRMLAYSFTCKAIPPAPSPPPLPYWVVKNSWGPGYGDHGYILMQRGVGKTGICCINCQPQYVVAEKGPAPPPAPPPPRCSVDGVLGCYNGTGAHLFPNQERQLHDHVSQENCAAACFQAKMAVAGIDGGNHCTCGSTGSLANSSGLLRPVAECQAINCSGAREERCGGIDRMIVYNFTCNVTSTLTDELSVHFI